MQAYNIVNTTKDDLEFIYTLFDQAIAYQKRKGFPVWNGYDREALKRDVENKLQFKIIIGNNILCVFSICYADPIIWREKEKGNALYLHRIVVNPEYKGQKQFGKILHWALLHAKENEIEVIRMDTWGNNSTIIDYYQSFGFKFIENYITPDSQDLPIQHRNLAIALLEMSVT